MPSAIRERMKAPLSKRRPIGFTANLEDQKLFGCGPELPEVIAKVLACAYWYRFVHG